MKDRLRSTTKSGMPAPPVIAVGGIVYRVNRRQEIQILLIKKQGGFWTLPKGHVETGEDQNVAVAREVYEETGITGEVQQRVYSVSYIVLKRGIPRTKIVTYYLVRATRGRLRPDKKEHIVRVKWFDLAAAKRRVKRARIRTIIEQATALLARQNGEPASDF